MAETSAGGLPEGADFAWGAFDGAEFPREEGEGAHSLAALRGGGIQKNFLMFLMPTRL